MILVNISHFSGLSMPPQGFWGSGENDYLFSGSWRALVIIFRELGSKLIVLGSREPCKKEIKNRALKEKPSFRLIFSKNLRLLGGSPPAPPPPLDI